jgi:hypothetical protein
MKTTYNSWFKFPLSCWIEKPCKRTIVVSGKSYYLQFPYMVWFVAEGTYAIRLAFTDTDQIVENTCVYFPPLPNTFLPYFHTCGSGYIANIENAVNDFWQSEFKGYDYSNCDISTLEKTFGSLENWSRLNLDEVMQKMKVVHTTKKSEPISHNQIVRTFKDFVCIDDIVKQSKFNGFLEAFIADPFTWR